MVTAETHEGAHECVYGIFGSAISLAPHPGMQPRFLHFGKCGENGGLKKWLKKEIHFQRSNK